VSVVTDSYSMGSTVRVRIKDAGVSKSIVEGVARRHERVRRCAVTGDILGGGNTFVDVEYTPEAMAPLRADLAALLATLPEDGTVLQVAGGAYRVFRADRYDVRIVDAQGERLASCHGLDCAARQLAEIMLDRGGR
jgi:hypothetical protein